MKLHAPSEPCSSCPYRKDTPPGIWDVSEYIKMPEYDEPSHADWLAGKMPALGVFLCHHSRLGEQEAVCRGWLAVHCDSIAVRLAVLTGKIPMEAPFEPVAAPLYASGADACAAGLAGVEEPDEDACDMIEKLQARKKRCRRRRRPS